MGGGSRCRAGRQPGVHGVAILGIAFWSAEDEPGSLVSVAHKGGRTPWSLPIHLQPMLRAFSLRIKQARR